MSYISTLRIQLEKPFLRGSKGGHSVNTESVRGSLHHIGNSSHKVEEVWQSNGESSQAGGFHKHAVTNGGRCTTETQEQKTRDVMVMPVQICPRQAVKTSRTSDRFLTVILELCPQKDGEIGVRRVAPKDISLTATPSANRWDLQDIPLLDPLESHEPESDTSRQEIETMKATLPGVPEAFEIKPASIEVMHQEEEVTPTTAQTLSSLCKESNVSHIGPELSNHEPSSTCPAKEPVSPKRKPSRSGNSLKILDAVDQVKVRVGEHVELCCGIRGTPPLAASWLRNKKQIVDGPRISTHTSDTESRLLISQVCEDDSGCYTLCVQDKTGSTLHHTSLTVVEHPSPPLGKPLISAVQPSSLTLSWSGPCYDGGSAVLNYFVEVKSVKEEGWTLLTDSCVSTSYRVEAGLKPGGKYQFRVRASNVHGVSEPGEESDVVTMSNTGDWDAECEEPKEYTKVLVSTTEKVSDLYIQLEKLGMGKFGQVYKLQERSTGKIRAGKFFKTRTKKELASALAEVELMNKLHHPKLVHCVAAFQERGFVVMVLEYIAGGELFERIVADDFEHTETMCVEYMSQILTGVAYMHHQSIVHLDLKPENIVCINQVSNRVKIIDFGLARELDPRVPVKVLQGTAEFVAPEVLSYDPVGFTTDMWSLGVICYILVSGDSPFQGDNDMETLRNITSASWEFDEETDAVLSEAAKGFIRNLLQKNMRSRLTADQALDHPWLKDRQASNTTTLSKERIKKFLARQKWQKTGRAVLALNRMTHLSNRSDSNSTSPLPEDGSSSPEVFGHLQEQPQGPPVFSSSLKDQVEVVGSTARFHCHITGFPDPEVLWFYDSSPIQESRRFQIEYEDSGSCSLIISNVSTMDSGVYTCQALNSLGEAETSAKLTVHSLHAERRARYGSERNA